MVMVELRMENQEKCIDEVRMSGLYSPPSFRRPDGLSKQDLDFEIGGMVC